MRIFVNMLLVVLIGVGFNVTTALSWNNGPTTYIDEDTPWMQAGIRYMEWKPDITNPEHTVGPSVRTRFHIIDDVMYIDGEIQPYLADEFIFNETSDIGNVTTIVLNSYGGEIKGGYALAEIIKKKGLTTVVPAGGVCMSACTVVFQAGTIRKAHTTAIFMYHGIRVSSVNMLTLYKDVLKHEGQESAAALWDAWTVNSVAKTEEMFAALEKYGASPELFRHYKQRPEDPNYFDNGNPYKISNWYMSAKETQKYDIVQEIF